MTHVLCSGCGYVIQERVPIVGVRWLDDVPQSILEANPSVVKYATGKRLVCAWCADRVKNRGGRVSKLSDLANADVRRRLREGIDDPACFCPTFLTVIEYRQETGVEDKAIAVGSRLVLV